MPKVMIPPEGDLTIYTSTETVYFTHLPNHNVLVSYEPGDIKTTLRLSPKLELTYISQFNIYNETYYFQYSKTS